MYKYVWVQINRNSLATFDVNGNNIIYFDKFDVEYIPKEI